MNRRRKAMRTAFWTLLLAAILIRLGAAWYHRFDVHADRALSAIMTVHLLAGEYPTAFPYGQTGMGTLEPILTALLARTTGLSLFALNLGVTLIGLLILPLLYHWTRSAGGRLAALAAMAWLTLGPATYFIKTTVPRGGFAIPVLLTVAILWLTGLLARRESARTSAPNWMCGLLGLLTGLAWWSSPFTLALLLTSGLWILAATRGRIFNRRILNMVILFFLASLPWWIWNFFHQAGSLRIFPRHPRENDVLLSAQHYFRSLLNLLQTPPEWGPLRLLLPLLLLALLAGGILLALHAIRTRKTFPGWIHLGIALTFLLLFSALQILWPPNVRHLEPHLLPVLPPLALLLGTSSAWLFHRYRRPLPAALPLLFLLAAQPRAILRQFNTRQDRAQWEHAADLLEFCTARNIEAAYINPKQRWLNFAAAERIFFCDLYREPYAPYVQRANQADRIALLDNIDEAAVFLQATRAAASVATFGDERLMYDFGPPPQPARPFEREQVRSVQDELGNDRGKNILDMDADTAWTAFLAPDQPPRTLTIHLDQPGEVTGLRLWCNQDRYPARFSAAGRDAPGSPWTELLPIMPATPFYWSGPRPYWLGLYYRIEARFLPPHPLQELQITFHPHPHRSHFIELAALQLLGPHDPIPVSAWLEFIPPLIQTLKDRNIMRCFADRWLSAKIDEYGAARIETIQPAYMRRTLHSPDFPIRNEYHDIARFKPRDALIVPHAEAPALDRILREHNLPMRQTVIGPWTLFDFAPGQYTRQTAIHPALKWIGYACLSNRERTRKAKGHYHYREALDADAPERQITLLRQAVELYPRHKAAWHELRRTTAETGQRAQELRALKELAAISPETETPVKFHNGAKLLGFTPIKTSATPGDALEIHYYWECPPPLNPLDYAVFIHIQRGTHRFQDDHVFLEDIPEHHIQQQLTPETFITRRRFTVPEGTPPGDYTLAIGLYHRVTLARQRPSTRLKTHRRGILLPLPLTVQPGPAQQTAQP